MTATIRLTLTSHRRLLIINKFEIKFHLLGILSLFGVLPKLDAYIYSIKLKDTVVV